MSRAAGGARPRLRRGPARPSAAPAAAGRRPLPVGAPAVVEDLPYDAAGRPLPTLFWATCPALVAAVAALESAGGVARFESARGERRAALRVAGRGDALRAPPPPPAGRAVRGAAARRRRLACHGDRRRGPALRPEVPPRPRRPRARAPRLPARRAHPRGRGARLSGARLLHAGREVKEPQVKVAVVDLGTNSVRLLLARVEGGRVHDIVRETTVTRLGAGVDRRRRLDAAAAERTRACLAGYAAQTAGFAPEESLLVATSVLRDAADGPAFLDRSGRRTRPALEDPHRRAGGGAVVRRRPERARGGRPARAPASRRRRGGRPRSSSTSAAAASSWPSARRAAW